ncbi:DEAD/DEAH box helicase [Methanothrix soehngenii]|jgi:Fanconi anemia group M protein|uniref:DEAD/DEAH box helicase n=1 Tax=Methanothrix soehngenii TaxID=2223 RepID=UPI0023521A9A|nr:DEAD/DEAH box helicase [Methanothrix soehngenii]MDD5257233.1 DEAD/DEAH box helicase [Methanothrix soehngenii]
MTIKRSIMSTYLEHPLLKPHTVEKRLFQMDLAASALKSSSLIVVPTGLGKTVIALMVLLARLDKGRVLFLAPTKPLVEQHAAFLCRVLKDEGEVTMMTGEMMPEKRKAAWEAARITVSTPQVIENDLLSRRIDLEDVSLIIFDEAHRAVGNYAYVYIAERYAREGTNPLVLGITASPGSEKEKIAEICTNLSIENIQTRTEKDSDVAPFVHSKQIEWVKLTVPKELLDIRSAIEDVLLERIDDLNRLGISPARIDPRATKKELLGLQAMLMSSAKRQANQATFKGISILAEVLKLYHAVELAETQGTEALLKYFQRLQGEAISRSGSKASRRIMEDPKFRQAMQALEELKVEHPKPAMVRKILTEQIEAKPESRIMVFTNYRDTASALIRFLKEDPKIKAVRFVGQSSRADDEGLSQKKQAEILQRFRAGEYNVLIATSVGEEGIDIPATDMVLFYEPVPSEIRSIQRKGRTGRARSGRVVVLMARGTRDEAYYWISDRKEKTMNKQMRTLSGQASQSLASSSNEFLPRQLEVTEDNPERQNRKGQESLVDWAEADKERNKIYVDPRERGMAKLLEGRGAEVTLKNLEVGDYVVSDRVAIERKTAQDFVASIIDPERNLFRQVADLARSYERPVLILEGRDLYSRQVSASSIQGALASVAVDYGVPIIPTEDQEDTASVITMLAARERREGHEPKLHGHKTARTLKEQQEYLISAIPSVGPSVARKLLRHFGSIEKVIAASKEELQEVDMVGPKIAERIRELVGVEYKG